MLMDRLLTFQDQRTGLTGIGTEDSNEVFDAGLMLVSET
jgi:hypothetical protein